MFFSKPGTYPPCRMFSFTHIAVLIFCIICIAFFAYKTRNIGSKKLNNITKIIAISLVVLESCKIILSFVNGQTNPDSYVPLYFCSIFIYATILAGFAKGKLKKLGEAFIGSGGIIAGGVFLISPSTSIETYPMFHFLSCYSMLYHSLMVYLGIGYLLNGVVVLNKITFIRYIIYCLFFSIIAIVANNIYNTNFMFLREPYNIPLAFLTPLSTDFPVLYTLFILISCIGVTYMLIDFIVRGIKFLTKKESVKYGKDNFD